MDEQHAAWERVWGWQDERGRPISGEEAARLLHDPRRRVAVTRLRDIGCRVLISTVFLSLGHMGPDWQTDRAARYETMVFGGPHDDLCIRYYSRREARRGHNFLVFSLRLDIAERVERRRRKFKRHAYPRLQRT